MNRNEAKERIFAAVAAISKAADDLREVERDVVCQCNLPPQAIASLSVVIPALNDIATDLDLKFCLVGATA